MTLHWTEADGVLTCRDGDAVVFRDTADHWTNAVCRLLGLSDEQGRAWVAHVAAAARGTYGRSLAALDGHDTIEALAAGSRAAFPVPAGHVDPPLPVTPGTCGHAPGRFWSTWMSEAAGFAIAGCGRCDHGWLVDLRRADQKLVETVAYDQAYFEGAEHGLGYGNYLQQQGWRLEKARRLLRQVSAACLYGNVAPPDDRRALDVGSGYGVFRKALDEQGWRHDGVELSQYACDVGKKLFGYDTFAGFAEDFLARRNAAGRYHLVTLWDVIEHVPDVPATLRTMHDLLAPGGVLAIRTPSIAAVERHVFGGAYHSYKKEHLNYFSPRSLTRFLAEAGLETVLVATQSHLLNGFFHDKPGGSLFDRTLSGSDIFQVAVRR